MIIKLLIHIPLIVNPYTERLLNANFGSHEMCWIELVEAQIHL